jgi:hypothetical protein
VERYWGDAKSADNFCQFKQLEKDGKQNQAVQNFEQPALFVEVGKTLTVCIRRT